MLLLKQDADCLARIMFCLFQLLPDDLSRYAFSLQVKLQFRLAFPLSMNLQVIRRISGIVHKMIFLQKANRLLHDRIRIPVLEKAAAHFSFRPVLHLQKIQRPLMCPAA